MPFASLVPLALFLAALPPQARDSLDFIVWNHGRRAGEMQIVRTSGVPGAPSAYGTSPSADESVAVRYLHIDRQRGPRIEATYRLRDGRPVWGELRSGGAQAASVDIAGKPIPLAASFFALGDGVVRSWSEGDTTVTPAPPGAWYRPSVITPYDDAALAAWLLRQPQRQGRVVPAATARVEIVAEATVPVGARQEQVQLAAIHGIDLGPLLVWIDARGALVATGAGWFIAVRRGAESALPELRRLELAWLEQRDAAVAARFAPKPAAATVIRNGDLFDSETGRVRARMSVVITGDRITALGPADSIQVPAGATVIDATGKTIIPGMWDMHTHASQGSVDGMLQLAAGITTIRDMASDLDVATSRRDRADRGTLVAPRMLLAGFIEGPGKWAGPTEILVRTEDEARAIVARYDSLGYRQIKLYNLVHPDLVPVIAAEAHARGMRLSGHIPRGMTIQAAVRTGYDEVQHGAYLFSTFFQDSLYYPRMRAYSEVAATVAPTFNVDAPEVTALIGFLRERGTVFDGTFNIWQDRSRLLPDGTDPVFGPSIDWLPPIDQRSLRAGGGGASESLARAQAASTNYRRMIKRLFDAGVTLVAGTDNVAGLSFHGELEIYERAGIPAPNVLQIATITAARVMRQERDYGSVAVGKVADLAIVAGKPAVRITDLRKTELVVRAGRVYRSRALYEGAGVSQFGSSQLGVSQFGVSQFGVRVTENLVR
ncbi:MAG: amidohydrolase family protein [Gemmatimonadaceae bacterium]|nr:amidohydrolase family protein [Gemmatimonadaceae bacterium]